MSQNILKYESDIWAAADLLISSGIKQSDFPKYMMPFFALRMVESRIVRTQRELNREYNLKCPDFVTPDDKEKYAQFLIQFENYKKKLFSLEEFKISNDFVLMGRTLSTIVENDTTYEQDFKAYLSGFDAEAQRLLGINKGSGQEKYLDISGISGLLIGKNILFETLSKWAKIDLTEFDNSEITTLEEHIKRKWADFSADTAGEQYTPDDIIKLIAEIVNTRVGNKPSISVYDPTCGGGNLLFGVEDALKDRIPVIQTNGVDWNSALYALACIESMFREDSEIKYGNTLTSTFFTDKRFDVVVANPPYGVPWAGYEKEVRADQLGQFCDFPPKDDGQLLFDQHISFQLADDGIAVIVNNGSALFSGDAGRGESNIRKFLLDKDWVEAIIQMPTQEFFNTGIYTYLWVLNKSKSEERKDKVMLIDASNFWVQLKKSKGNKRREISEENRQYIIDAFVEGKENEFCKSFSKYYFYYNKQKLSLKDIDYNNKALDDEFKLNPSCLKYNGGNITCPKDMTLSQFLEFRQSNDAIFNPLFDMRQLAIVDNDFEYSYDSEIETIVRKNLSTNKLEQLGKGKFIVDHSVSKGKKKKDKEGNEYREPDRYNIFVKVSPIYQKDFEIIPYSPNEEENTKNIDDFLSKYVIKPFVKLDDIIGCEVNFNKVFYKPEELPSVENLLDDISALNDELKKLEEEWQE